MDTEDKRIIFQIGFGIIGAIVCGYFAIIFGGSYTEITAGIGGGIGAILGVLFGYKINDWRENDKRKGY